MRIEVLVVIVTGVIVTYILWRRSHNIRRSAEVIKLHIQRNLSIISDRVFPRRGQTEHYTVTKGSWQLNWDPPTVGTPPFVYDYEIRTNLKGIDQIVQAGTGLTEPTVILDPTKLIPDPGTGGYMSAVMYRAIVKARNTAGIGPHGELVFKIYDTPAIKQITNMSTRVQVYPTKTGSIFRKPAANTYEVASLGIILTDEVAREDINATLIINGKSYPSAPPVKGPPEFKLSWTVFWDPKTIPVIGPDTTVKVNITITNPAGTGPWSETYVTPKTEPIAPSMVTGPAVKFVKV